MEDHLSTKMYLETSKRLRNKSLRTMLKGIQTLNFKIIVIFFLIYVRFADSKTLIGIVDHLSFNRPSDYAKVGEFCFKIPPETMGSIDSEVVIVADGHRLIVLKDYEETEIAMNPNLARYNPNEKRRLFHNRGEEILSNHFSNMLTSELTPRRHLSNNTIMSTSTHNPTNILATHEASSKDVLMTPSSAHAIGIPHKETEFKNSEAHKATGKASVIARPTLSPLKQSTSPNQTTNQPKSDPVQSGITSHIHKEAIPLTSSDVVPPIVISDDPEKSPSRATTVCDALVERSRVTETLRPVGHLSSYHLVLWVKPHIDGHRVSILITRCGAEPYAEYRIIVNNPGGFLKAQFSCEDQGLLELYSVAFFGSLLLLIPLKQLWISLVYLRKEQPVIDVFFLAALSFVVYLGLNFTHLLAYSFNGLGFSVLTFLGGLADLVFIVSCCFIISSLLLEGSHQKQKLSLMSDEDEQKSISSTTRFETSNALFPSGSTLSFRTRLRTIGELMLRLGSTDCLLAVLAFTTLFVVFCSAMKSSFITDPLTPGWRVSNPRLDGTLTGFIFYLAILFYFVLRYIFAGLVVRKLVFVASQSQNEVTMQRKIALICAFLWLIGFPSFALFRGPFHIVRHGAQFGLLAANFVVLISLGKCLMEERGHGFYRAVSTSDAKTTSENSGLVPVGKRGDRSLSGYTTAASSVSHITTPSFPTPAWDKDADEDLGEPELIDISQLPRAGGFLGYNTLR